MLKTTFMMQIHLNSYLRESFTTADAGLPEIGT